MEFGKAAQEGEVRLQAAGNSEDRDALLSWW